MQVILVLLEGPGEKVHTLFMRLESGRNTHVALRLF